MMISNALLPARVLLRIMAVCIVLIATLALTVAVALCPIRTVRGTLARSGLTYCSRWLLAALGVRRDMSGPMPPPGSLLLSNHLSWLDVPVALACWPCTFVAKQEVRRWPLIGTLGDALGVIWIERSRPRDLLRAIPALETALRAGEIVLLFPEGTTTNGHSVLPFRSGLLEGAVQASASVVPVALSGAVVHGDVDALCWYGDETLLANLPRVVALEAARMRVHISAPISPSGDRKLLARAARDELLRYFRGATSRDLTMARVREDGRVSATLPSPAQTQ